MDLPRVVEDVADALVAIDMSQVPFKPFHAGVGPYGESQVVRGIALRLNALEAYRGVVRTKRCPC